MNVQKIKTKQSNYPQTLLFILKLTEKALWWNMTSVNNLS